jgi:hypothetical protein
MSNPADSTPEGLYEAYLTTERVGGTRTPIAAERIVIVLGQDEGGRPLELSIVLKKSAHPGRLTVYSINEPLLDDSRRGLFPVPVVESCPAVNVFQVSIRYEPTHPGEAGAVEEARATTGERADDSGARCSFCRESRPEVGPLVEGAGPEGTGGVFICRACTELSLAIFEQERRR